MNVAQLVRLCQQWQKIHERAAMVAAIQNSYQAHQKFHDLYEGLCVRSKSLGTKPVLAV
jgi:hypothetical protein